MSSSKNGEPIPLFDYAAPGAASSAKSTRSKSSRPRGSAIAESRYTGLKAKLAADLFDQGRHDVDVTSVKRLAKEFEFIDLFSGAGGISCGLRAAGFKKILSNEIDRDASDTIRRNFQSSIHIEGPIEDISIPAVLPSLRVGSLPLVIGGPPCQGFSVAGSRNADDPRNHLFAEFIRIVSETKPWFVVIENVPGILTLAGGKYRDKILAALDAAGYKASVKILEAAEYGVPQLRTRAIFIANRFGLPNPFPRPTHTRDQYIPIEDAIVDLADLPPTPEINHEWTKHTAAMEKRLACVPPGGSLYDTYRDAWKRQHMGVPCMTIKENHGGSHIHPWLNRVISAREMARLQSFPDDYIFSGTMKRAMWQIGNAVPPRLAEAVGLALLPSLRQIRDSLI